jgi:D-glycero-D-manno-heptose 1,7-bisphosphate phosphatase
MPTQLLLLDCDSTIRKPISGAKFIQHPEDQKIMPGADQAIIHYHQEGWVAVGITNQGGVAAGHKQLKDAITEQEYTLQLLPQLLCIYFCPDFCGNHCWLVGRGYDAKPIHLAKWAAEFFGTFRKPQLGMLKVAMKNHCGLDCEESYVGDAREDKKATTRAGISYVSGCVARWF